MMLALDRGAGSGECGVLSTTRDVGRLERRRLPKKTTTGRSLSLARRKYTFTILAWICISLIGKSQTCLARLEAAVILPHGDFAYDPTLVAKSSPSERAAAECIAAAARRAARWFHKDVDPDAILLVTPHGIALSHDFGIYLGAHASGYADIGADLHRPNGTTYRVNLPRIPLAPDLATSLLDQFLWQGRTNVSGIQTSADDSQDTPLQWAEVVPLLLLNESSSRQRPHLIWSQPLRRFGPSAGADMVDELLHLGRRLFQWMEGQPLVRWGVLVSADLAHTHRADGPYGYSEAAVPFDAVIGHWAQNPCPHGRALLDRAAHLQPAALSCGFTGMVLLHGMMCGDERDAATVARGSLTQWYTQVFANQNVTYYGMMATTLQRQHSEEPVLTVAKS
jgi:aromatic ring-opening dioxygenase LigB subunit